MLSRLDRLATLPAMNLAISSLFIYVALYAS